MKKLRPILFSTPMVQAILEGRKTQTRRVVKSEHLRGVVLDETMYNQMQNRCRYGKVGDVLWVRESWNGVKDLNGKFIHYRFKGDNDPFHNGMRWKPSIHMPFEAARIFLEIMDVRVEQLQYISDQDAKSEGVNFTKYVNATARYHFMELWKSINGEYSWNSNPWVWVLTFNRITKEEATK